jgi:hypothetical protein
VRIGVAAILEALPDERYRQVITDWLMEKQKTI